MRKRFILYALAALCLLGAKISFGQTAKGPIQNKRAHSKNCKILSGVIRESVKELSPSEAALWLSENLNEVASEAVKQGFDPAVYNYMSFGETDYLTFTSLPVWEGKKEGVDLTFFVYAWPPEEYALSRNKKRFDKENCVYLSNIHSHPISCSFTVLSRSITECRFERTEDNHVRLTGETRYHVGEGDFDNQTSPFIHQMVCQCRGKMPAITLHAYGASDVQSVKEAFSASSDECTFLTIEQPDGSLTVRSW